MLHAMMTCMTVIKWRVGQEVDNEKGASRFEPLSKSRGSENGIVKVMETSPNAGNIK